MYKFGAASSGNGTSSAKKSWDHLLIKLMQFESPNMHKSLVKHRPHRLEPNDSDGHLLFVALISAFVLSTLAIVVGLGFALMA